MNKPETKPDAKRRSSGRITLSDVAKAAEVSPITASRALRGERGVAQDVREAAPAALRGTFLGCILGVLPGAGPILGLHVEQILSDGYTPSRTVFGLRRRLGCWWVHL